MELITHIYLSQVRRRGVDDAGFMYGVAHVGKRFKQRADEEEDDEEDEAGHDVGDLSDAADGLLDEAAGQRRSHGPRLEERAGDVAEALGEQLLVRVDLVVLLQRQDLGHGERRRVGDDGDYCRAAEHVAEQLETRDFGSRHADRQFSCNG